MLGQGLLLLVSGMGTVVIFLCVMIWIMMSVGVYFKKNESRFQDEPAANPAKKSQSEPVEALVAAIAVSLLPHK